MKIRHKNQREIRDLPEGSIFQQLKDGLMQTVLNAITGWHPVTRFLKWTAIRTAPTGTEPYKHRIGLVVLFPCLEVGYRHFKICARPYSHKHKVSIYERRHQGVVLLDEAIALE